MWMFDEVSARMKRMVLLIYLIIFFLFRCNNHLKVNLHQTMYCNSTTISKQTVVLMIIASLEKLHIYSNIIIPLRYAR